MFHRFYEETSLKKNHLAAIHSLPKVPKLLDSVTFYVTKIYNYIFDCLSIRTIFSLHYKSVLDITFILRTIPEIALSLRLITCVVHCAVCS